MSDSNRYSTSQMWGVTITLHPLYTLVGIPCFIPYYHPTMNQSGCLVNLQRLVSLSSFIGVNQSEQLPFLVIYANTETSVTTANKLKRGKFYRVYLQTLLGVGQNRIALYRGAWPLGVGTLLTYRYDLISTQDSRLVGEVGLEPT